MDDSNAWRDCFQNWPDGIPRRGILVTNYAEQVGFDAFFTNPEFLLISRNAPDALGARQLVIRYKDISALKIIDVVDPKAWAQLGFTAAATKPPPSAKGSPPSDKRPDRRASSSEPRRKS